MTDWTRGSYSALSRAMEYFNKYAGLDENGNQTGPMAGGIVLFAAGNDASNEICYPAADANAISVGATGFTGTPAYYTNYGKWVRISAPGGDQMLSNAYGGVYSTSVAADGSSGYEGSQGTSMALPPRVGACALAVSYYYGAKNCKGLTGEMLRQALLSSTQSVDRYCTGSYMQYLGNMGIGSLDTYKLLRTIAKIDGIPAQRVGRGRHRQHRPGQLLHRHQCPGVHRFRPRPREDRTPGRSDEAHRPQERPDDDHRLGRRGHSQTDRGNRRMTHSLTQKRIKPMKTFYKYAAFAAASLAGLCCLLVGRRRGGNRAPACRPSHSRRSSSAT